MKQRLEHRFDEDGKPIGLIHSVERVRYLGSGIYSLSRLEAWQSAAVVLAFTVLILLGLYFGWLPPHR